ncbi:hydroxyisourate hydrolase [Pararhizobium mangrovi]|uniref:5-hydroxyisourate hydrolase n=1 Tax=Pararhizobium mangrovi TaxID=2590452 RepID=A0A506U088_9HYPH|nr:hydroxyisourate hydrolase [Pararhizobium mangrovi]TPW26621.1 hydroxyisourate hydrolase [Pararhizobium mangrovi]
MAEGGFLTTHVLDTATGRPAAGLVIDLARLDGDNCEKLTSVTTNADGRAGAPILQGDAFTVGTYELAFHAGDYLRASGAPVTEPAFLDVVPIRFAIADPAAHYHVPLLLSPYGYTTYRGS